MTSSSPVVAVEPNDVADSPGHETYFAKPEHFFPHLTDDGKIPTAQFLSACQGIADFVSFLGATFSLVRKDIQGNVDKVRVRFEKDQEGQKYLQQLIDADLAEHGGKFGIATEGLLWLKRGLQFMLELLTEMVTAYNSGLPRDKTEDLSGAVATAYGKSLKRHHGFIAKQAFKVVTMAVPYRRQILKAVALGQEGLDDVCIHHIQCHLDNFRLNVKTLVDYYIEKKLDTPDV
ncbi:Glycolipid transfer protein domain-containing protein [Caenorhabditis elegans]|uniref:Glycolipid transfer protein domain-containing protein n=1 Tax=Caenorhabditis elegans TaxID=6239 RepID=Q9BKS2_CAEEL|nr:Glycolipid transfer protein domain-containing protein [Caenorhabditis elegans]CCD73045.1 Glycolipid transfer protein domain-containing protein [Caenorhabditis elegans]|eukprot:NP_001022958.1 Uncharacterized protein CELE_Y82E9BR.14 [Caenorhabditis elegans]